MTYEKQITITIGASRKALEWKPQKLTVGEFFDRLSHPAGGTETLSEYLALSKSRQDELKDVGGYVAGQLTGPRRKAGSVLGRDVVTLDLDTIPAGGTAAVLGRVQALGYCHCVYSTRKHRPDAPRLRILLPLDRTVSADEYEPIARMCAQFVGLEYADPSTFEPSRLMYWPSVCADGEFVFQAEDGPAAGADCLLGLYADWHDAASWPAVPGETGPARPRGKRMEDPTAKSGIVGAFCKVYDVPAAMAAFLPGVYAETGTPGRYTYTGGSTTGGALVYDEGRFLFSHHATDPCGGREVNSFDLVRLHLFADQDDDAKPDTPVSRLPSFQAMSKLAAADPQVAGKLLDERYEKATAAFGDPPAAEEDDGAWRRPPLMNVDPQGRPAKTMKNYRTALENDPRLKGRIRLNLFSGRVEVFGELPWPRPGSSKVWNDEDGAQLRIYLEPFFGKAAKQDVLDAVGAAASDQAFHPVRDYLNALTWDGTPRLDTLLIDYLGAEDSPYTRAVTRKALVAAVGRIFRPGVKYDTMVVLVGAQGRHKSTLLAKLGGEWFSDSLRTFGDKDAMETIQGTWINEIAEMQALAKADVDAVKMFLSKTADYYRPAYGRYTSERPRQCVFWGTTNSRDCLTDTTGSRRFWVVDIDRQPRTRHVFRDLDGERDQLWAEAVALYRLGEPLHLDDDLEAEARRIQEDHRVRHPWEGLILDYLAEEVPENWSSMEEGARSLWHCSPQKSQGTVKKTRICALEIWCEALGRKRGEMRKSDAQIINSLLERIPGWASVGVKKAGKPYGNQRCFDKEDG